MTKTKKNKTWKLKDLPSATEIADLVDSGVITKDEARDIIFGNAENDKDKIEALESLVKFLQGLVQDLAKQRLTTTYLPIQRTIEYRPGKPWDTIWMSTEKILSSSGLSITENKDAAWSKQSYLGLSGPKEVMSVSIVNDSKGTINKII